MSTIHHDSVAQVQAGLLDDSVIETLARTFAVLADPTRVKLLLALANRELCVGDLVALTGLTQSAVSHQLALLRLNRLVRSRKVKTTVFYTADDGHLVALFREGLSHLEHVAHSVPDQSFLARGSGGRNA